VLFGVLFAVLFPLFFAFFLLQSLRGRSDYLEGCTLLNQGRWKEAVDAFTRATEKSPMNSGYEYQRGVALMQLLRVEEAQQSFAKVQGLKQPAACRDLFAATGQLVLALQGKPTLAVGEASLADRVLTRAVELVRKSEWQAALDELQHPSQQMHWGTVRTLKEALVAWCHAQLGKEKRTVDLSTLANPGVADVGTFWPELAQFLKSTSA
jgi:tetratricopeptide (TPR) repeat protein